MLPLTDDSGFLPHLLNGKGVLLTFQLRCKNYRGWRMAFERRSEGGCIWLHMDLNWLRYVILSFHYHTDTLFKCIHLNLSQLAQTSLVVLHIGFEELLSTRPFLLTACLWFLFADSTSYKQQILPGRKTAPNGRSTRNVIPSATKFTLSFGRMET